MSVLRLAIPSPLRRLFDYLPPEGCSEETLRSVPVGARVRVPFGRREVTGFLVQTAGRSELPEAQLKQASAILDSEPLLPGDLIELALWACRYYHHPPGEVFSALFPRRLREGKESEPPGTPGWMLTTRGKGLPPDAMSRSPKQAQALNLLRTGGQMSRNELKARGIGPAILKTLAEKGLAERCTLVATAAEVVARSGPQLNSQQQAALAAIKDSPAGFSCHLLEGVTGSGKTEIFLRLIADCLSEGRQALVLIPEIGLTPQTLSRFQARFDAEIAVLHSGLSEAQRYRAWEGARSGSAHIVIGTRSAVFSPLAQPGLIIVDEEHDGSYKQQDGFRYSARDVAIKRAQILGCPILLGSATPSLESMHNARSGRFAHHRLTARAGAAAMPSMQVVDVRKRPLAAGLSAELMAVIETTLQRGEQVLLFLNRRGYAPTLQCHDCGWIGECDACDARLTMHRRQGRLRCHHCGASQNLPRDCPACHSSQLLARGLGTEQTEAHLRDHFSRFPIYRVDSDSMQGRETMGALVEEINRGQPCILLGTQMLAKGHHFPAVTLVAVIDADALLFSADFRGEERMAQLLTQVAGRAGRAQLPGQVLLQSHYPDHPMVQSLLQQDYSEHASALLAEREAGALPPFGLIVVLRADCTDARYTEDFLLQLRRSLESALPAGVALIGPLPSPLQRRAGRHRFQLLLTAPDRRAAHTATSQMVSAAEAAGARKGLKWSLDVDPQDLF